MWKRSTFGQSSATSPSPVSESTRVLPAFTGTAYLRTAGEQRTTSHVAESSTCASTTLPLSAAGQVSSTSNTAFATTRVGAPHASWRAVPRYGAPTTHVVAVGKARVSR